MIAALSAFLSTSDDMGSSASDPLNAMEPVLNTQPPPARSYLIISAPLSPSLFCPTAMSWVPARGGTGLRSTSHPLAAKLYDCAPKVLLTSIPLPARNGCAAFTTRYGAKVMNSDPSQSEPSTAEVGCPRLANHIGSRIPFVA